MKKPIKLLPAFKDYLWGGERLKKDFNKKTDMEIVAESWELSTHKDGESIVSSGEYTGLKFS
jgi:mannose-6-phosphate isomerase